jgi:hypothetical protein
MHINEQSPARLRRALQNFFPYVKVWVGSAADPSGSLSRKLGYGGLTSAPDIYALASHAPLDLERAEALLATREFPEGEHARISLQVDDWPNEVRPAEMFSLEVAVTNDSSRIISSLPPFPVFLSYHWSNAAGDRMMIYDGRRSGLPFGINSGEKRVVPVGIEAPPNEGSFLLTISLVQEGCVWFEDKPGFISPQVVIAVKAVG